jgi:hypothetical protein
MNKKILLTIVSLILIIISISFAYSLSFSSNPVITPTNATTETPLVCSWESEGVSEANVSWYNGSDLIKTVVDAASSQSLSETYTTKGETWNCTVIIANSTSVIKKSDTQIIQNALPSKPNAQNRTLYEDAYFTKTLQSTDPDEDTVTYIESSPTCDFDSFDQNTGQITWTPEHTDVGNHSIVFQASDDGGVNAVGIRVTWEVIAVNDAPQFVTSLQTQYSTEEELFTYDIDAIDEENDTIYYYDNTNMFEIDNQTGLINFTPQFSDVGTHIIEINITDGMNSTIGTFTLHINSTNHVPILHQIQNYSILQNQTLAINLSGYDRDNDTVTFSASGGSNDFINVSTIDGSNIYQEKNATGILLITPLNENVGNNTLTVNITDDKGASSSQDIVIEVINTNDPPSIDPIPDQVAAGEVIFTLQVNGSDPDLNFGDNITYYDNTPIFDINTTTGVIEFNVSATIGLIDFTPNGTYVGNFSITITVNDSFGLEDNTTFNLEIINNSAPIFNQTSFNQTAYEDSIFTVQINASDPNGDNFTFSDNSTFFNINRTTGLINFTPVQDNVGNHTVRIYATDSWGAVNYADFNLEIININDPPLLNPINFPLMRVNLSFSYTVTATDEDRTFGIDDNLTFYSYNSSIINITHNGIISFIPAEEHVGTHSVNITVRDSYNASDSVIVNFTIYNASYPPNITKVYPYGSPVSAITVFGWNNRSNFPGSITNINVSENSSITFAQNTTALVENGELSFSWYFNGGLVSTNNQNYTRVFNYTSSGNHNLTIVVRDELAYATNFTWNITVKNKNRPPVLSSPLLNISVNSTTTFQDYLNKFYDPDGDDLSFNVTSSSLARFTITNDDLKVTPINTGLDILIFTATDGSLSTQSNNVTLNVTGSVEEEDLIEQSSSSGGGTRTIEVEVEVPRPTPLKIINPSTVTIYENDTVIVPVTIQNTWNDTLTGVVLGASSNISGLNFKFNKYYWDSIAIGTNVTTNLTITSYKSRATYEIKITANVSNPDYQDTSIIFVNSIEKGMGRYSEEVTNTKITFARDLLEGNPECIELNGILERAITLISKGNYEEANKLIDSAIQGCKYLVNMEQKQVEKPSFISLNLNSVFSNKIINYVLIGVIAALLIFGLIYIRKHAMQK